MFKRDLDFLYEVGSMRHLQRGWKQHAGLNVANVLEHTMRVMLLALMIARKEGVKDEEKIIKMALIHDLAETRCSDLSYVQKVYVKADEQKAATDLFNDTTLSDLEKVYLHEYEKRECIEAKIVKDADNLEFDIELKELEQMGSLLPEKWYSSRKFVRDEKLYTETARQIWDEIQNSNPDAWHLETNKWRLIPEAGK
ncbi:MAG: hypothetical protein QG665_515 [Patescibacteria group bacterium]|nr:hypothetical protein [Patescibacteria group bacterium]